MISIRRLFTRTQVSRRSLFPFDWTWSSRVRSWGIASHGTKMVRYSPHLFICSVSKAFWNYLLFKTDRINLVCICVQYSKLWSTTELLSFITEAKNWSCCCFTNIHLSPDEEGFCWPKGATLLFASFRGVQLSIPTKPMMYIAYPSLFPQNL